MKRGSSFYNNWMIWIEYLRSKMQFHFFFCAFLQSVFIHSSYIHLFVFLLISFFSGRYNLNSHNSICGSYLARSYYFICFFKNRLNFSQAQFSRFSFIQSHFIDMNQFVRSSKHPSICHMWTPSLCQCQCFCCVFNVKVQILRIQSLLHQIIHRKKIRNDVSTAFISKLFGNMQKLHPWTGNWSISWKSFSFRFQCNIK